MPPTYSIQPSFAGGEFSPSLYSRIDLQKYGIGLRTAKNMIIHPHGGASNRPGTKYIAETKDSTKVSRLVPFEFSTTQAYIIEFGDYYCRFYMNSGQIAVTPSDLSDIDPTASYVAGDYIKLGDYKELDCGSGKKLYVYAPYGTDTTGKTISIQTASSDTLSVELNAGAITIKLADTTPGSNKASLIQPLLRGLSGFSGYFVMENAAYAAARPTSISTVPAAALTAGDKTYICKATVTGNADNTSKFPATETTYWTELLIYEVPTIYPASSLAELKYTQSADILYLVHPDYPIKTLTRFGHADWSFDTFDFKNGPFMLTNVSATTLTASAVTGSVTITASTNTFDSTHVGSLWRLKHDVAGQSVGKAFTSETSSTSITCQDTWRVVTHGTWTGKLSIEKSTNAGSTWEVIRSFDSADDYNPNTYGEIDEYCWIRATMTSYTSGTCTVSLSSDPFTKTGIVKITAYTNPKTVTATVMQEVGSTAATTDWAEGSWSDYRGYPSSAIFYNDRLCFAATETEPQTIWTSIVSNYEDFGRSDDLEDSDGISVNISSRKMNGIKSMVGLDTIIALTSATEWSIGPGSTGAFTPTSIDAKCQGYRGSSNIDPVVIGNKIVYIQPMGMIVRDMGYDYNSNTYTGNDLSIFATHLFDGYEIKEIVYQQEPDSLIWAVRDDGILLSLTYLKEQEVLAWTWHETEGEVESIATIPGGNYDELWLIVKRGSKRFIEQMVKRMESTDPRDQFFLDCGVTVDIPVTITGISSADPGVVTAVAHGFSDGDLVDISDVVGCLDTDGESGVNNIRFKVANKTDDTFELTDEDDADVDTTVLTAYTSGGKVRKAVTNISGLSHLEGETVTILADGNVLDTEVVSSGAITIDVAASRIHIGLPYESDLETLNIEVQQQDGVAQGRKLKISKVIIRFLNSRGGWLGPNEDNLNEIIQRSDEPLGSPIDLYTGDYDQTINSQYDDGGRVFYRQTDPLPITILAIIPSVTFGG